MTGKEGEKDGVGRRKQGIKDAKLGEDERKMNNMYISTLKNDMKDVKKSKVKKGKSY